MSAFKKIVLHRLIERGMNQSDLASEIGVSVSYLSDILSDKRKGSDVRARICQFLDITE